MATEELRAALDVLQQDAYDGNREAMWRYGVRHSLSVIRAALGSPAPSMKVPTRYRRRVLLEGGGMWPDVHGQWVHVADLGVESWDLDELDGLPQLPSPLPCYRGDDPGVCLLHKSEWSEGDRVCDEFQRLNEGRTRG